MKSLKIYFYLFATSFAISSCGGDSVDCSAGLNSSQQFSNELQNISTAAAAYGADQSSANCNAYKEAWNKYSDALRPFGECAITDQEKASFNAALDQIVAEINQLTC